MRLRKERMQRGWSQETLAEQIGISRQGTISHWENGRQRPHPRTKAILGNIFGYKNPDDLFRKD